MTTMQVVTTFEDGRSRIVTLSKKNARNLVSLHRDRIGRDLIDEATGKTVRIVSVNQNLR